MSLYESLLAVPHSVAMIMQLGLFYLVNKSYYRDRLTIGLIFFALIAVAFITVSPAIDVVVLFSLSLVVCIQGVTKKNSHYVRISVCIMIVLFTMFSLFLYNFFH